MAAEPCTADLIREYESRGVEFQLDCGAVGFKAPPGKLTAAELSLLRERKAEVISLLRNRLDGELAGLLPEPVEAIWRAAPVQEDMVCDPAVQNSWSSVLWRGPFDPRAVRHALAGLVERHSALRTHFARGPTEELLAVTRASVEGDVDIVDLRKLDASRRRDRAIEVFGRLSWGRFDAYKPPLFAFAAVRWDDELTILALAVHHALCDAMAAEVISSDLKALYESALRGTPATMQPLSVEYRDFVREQSDWMRSEQAAAHIEYWQTVVSGARSVFRLPYDEAIVNASEAPAEVGATIAGAMFARLRSIALEEKATTFAVFVAIFYLTLANWSGGRDLASWVCHFGRHHPAMTSVVGCFLNFWLLRVQLDGQLTFAELVRRVQSAYASAIPHLRVSYDRVLAEIERSNGGEVCPGIMLNFIPYVRTRQAGGEVEGGLSELKTPVQRLSKESPLALIVHVIEGSESLDVAVWHNEGLFADDTMVGLCRSLVEIATRASGDPRLALTELAGSLQVP